MTLLVSITLKSDPAWTKESNALKLAHCNRVASPVASLLAFFKF
jgi:hypothetical protein